MLSLSFTKNAKLNIRLTINIGVKLVGGVKIVLNVFHIQDVFMVHVIARGNATVSQVGVVCFVTKVMKT
jgi:hypothetical protein